MPGGPYPCGIEPGTPEKRGFCMFGENWGKGDCPFNGKPLFGPKFINGDGGISP